MADRRAIDWLGKLEGPLRARQSEMARMDAYYRGEHDLPFLTRAHRAKLQSEFVRLLEESRSNFMRLVVDATEERLAVEGFRLSARSEENDDADAWAIWQANQMDAQSQTAFAESLIKGVSYLSVWADEDNDGYADIAVEDAAQTIVAYAPGSNYRRRDAALKIWADEWTGDQRANVYLPDGIYKFQARKQSPNTSMGRFLRREPARPEASWAPMSDGFYVPNPHKIVPIIPLRNRPRLLAEGESEIVDVIAIQNQVNGFLFLLALAGYFGAHRQRWALGIKIHQDEKTGKPIEPFNTATDTLWTNENPEGKFGEFNQTSLDGYLKALDQKVNHIATVTRTPRHYLEQTGQSPSGDALEGAEAGLVKKVSRKQRTFGEGLEEAIRLARKFSGKEDAPPDAEIVWADPAMRSEAAITDGVIKEFQARLITRRAALEKMGYSQTKITRIMEAPDAEFADYAQGRVEKIESEDTAA